MQHANTFFHLLCRLKIFLPITTLALLVLIPVNVSGGTLLDLKKEVVFSDIDKLSISNVNPGSNRYGSYEFLIFYTYIMSRTFSMPIILSVLFLHVVTTSKLCDHCHCNLFQILYSSLDGICVHILGMLYAVQRIQQCSIYEIAFPGFPEALC